MPVRNIPYAVPGPVAEAFIASDAFIRGIRGPVGSGKSVSCVMDMMKTAYMQLKGPDGVRRYRGVIIRNTYSELQTTTINTFHDWIPETYGKFTSTVPITHHIRDGELDAEFLFLALDKPAHIRKLLSLEVTQAWLNEAREIPKPVLDHLTMRVGRYPRREIGGAVRAGIIMDTNSPDSGHWWAKMADYKDLGQMEATRQLEKQLREMGALREDQPLVEFFTQPSAELQDGTPNPDAENLLNLPIGYYVLGKAEKTEDWIKVYIRNEYHFVMDGKAIYEGYRDNLHCVKHQWVPSWPIGIGMDFGLTPAATISQKSPMGQIRVLKEIVATRLGAKNFARQIKGVLAEHFPGAIISHITGDPSGDAGNAVGDTEETTVFTLLAAEGIVARPAPTNDPTIRIESVNAPMNRLIDGQPGLTVNPECQELRKACMGGYHYRRVQVTGEARYETKPAKNMSSHIAEALQYDLLGWGEGKAVVKKADNLVGLRPAYANAQGDYPGPQAQTPYRAPRASFSTRD